jgi:hypothetical protein
MTREEALIYLPLNEGDQLIEIYEDKLFEFKQFFLTRFPIPLVVYARLKKLRLVHQAYIILGGERQKPSDYIHNYIGSEDSIRKTFAEFQVVRNELKMLIHSAKHGPDLDAFVIQLLAATEVYAEYWRMNEVLESEGISVGKEPDPMDLLTAINDFESDGNRSFDDLWKFEGENPLKSEAKRLSLWLKFERNDK